VYIGASAELATDYYPSNGNRVLEYYFSISDTSETTTSTGTVSPNMALICVTSTAVTV
jgi:hypothetical protein